VPEVTLSEKDLRMRKKQKVPKPAETDSFAVDNVYGHQAKTEIDLTSSETATATASHKGRAATDVTEESETDAEEIILEREADGRYRIVGRRPRKQE
jgi:hypothetical protein